MESFDPLWLDTLRNTFAATLTDGYLRIRPLVVTLMTTTLSIGLFAGVVLAWFSSFHPTALVKIGDVLIRIAVLWAIANNWNYLFDGFMDSVVFWGLLYGGSTLTTQDFLQPGTLLLIGIRLSTNFYLILLTMADDIWYAPVLFFGYTVAWLIMVSVFGIMSVAILAAQVEYFFISGFAFLMWPLMPIWFTAWISTSTVRLLIAAALRLGGLATLISIVLRLVVALGIPDGEPSIQSAIVLSIGLAAMAYFVWKGPRMFGAAAWPGSGLVALGLLTAAAFRRR